MTSLADGGVVRVDAAGDSALVLQLPSRIDPEINDRATTVAADLRARWGAILRDVVVGYCTVTVYFDPIRVDGPWLEGEIRSAAAQLPSERASSPSSIEVPVCYDGDLAPDIGDVAGFAGCTAEEVIALHTSREYRVYMVGFVPGFAYLAEVDERIAAPRRVNPRVAVPAGSVAIAGGQTGIYPSETPGGWNIVGRTRVRPYEPSRSEPFLFRAGDTVRFVRISREEYERA